MNRTDRPWPAVAACTLLAAGALLPACECQKNACCPLPEGYACAELAFPTGDRSTSTILVRQASPKEARAGQECNYIIDVTNLTGSTLQNVSVKLEHMDNVHVVSSWPGALKRSSARKRPTSEKPASTATSSAVRSLRSLV